MNERTIALRSVLSVVMAFFLCAGAMAQSDAKQQAKLNKERDKAEQLLKKLMLKPEKYKTGIYEINNRKSYNLLGFTTVKERKEQFMESYEPQVDFMKKNTILLRYKVDVEENRYNVVFYSKFIYLPLNGETIFPGQTLGFNEMKNRGGAYFYAEEREWRYTPVPHWNGEDRFFWFDNFHWSGEVKDGELEGKGEGYRLNDDNVIYFVKGEFHEGKPIGECSFRRVTTKEAKQVNIDITPWTFGYMKAIKNGDTAKPLYADTNFNLRDNMPSTTKMDGANVYYEGNECFIITDDQNVTHHVSGVPFLRGIDGDYSGWQKDHWKLKSVSAFNDGYALVDISFLDRYKVMPVDLQYKIDREGNYAGYTQKSVDAGLAILKSVTQMKNQLLKVFNPRDIKDPIQNLKKKYGVDFDLIGKKYRVYQYLIHQLSDDLKVQNVGGMNDFGTLGTIRDVYWWFKSLEDEFTSLTYSNVTLKDRVSVRKRTVNLTGYTIKDIDKLLEASVITADAAQAAKNFLNKRTEQYSGAFQQVWDYEYSANQAAKKQEKYNAAEIDDRRSTPPSGKIVSPTFGAYGYHEKPGVIRFTKTSDEVYYNISYSGKDFHDFRIVDTVGLTIKTRNFRTEAAMIQEIIRAYKEKYR